MNLHTESEPNRAEPAANGVEDAAYSIGDANGVESANSISAAAMSADHAISIQNVGVKYRIPSERIFTFKEYMIRRIQGRIHQREFWALRNLTLEIYPGEVFGFIGHNGAGKSTLLKLVARVLKPTEGRVVVRGRVAPLLEVGAGFHSELTGRENVYLNGALLGFTNQEMEAKFSRIVDFAELWDFIDSPMRTYSSGMWARLGFAVATDTQPDILIVDEVLAVGDEAFQKKCYERIRQFRLQGATILLVSHNLSSIESLCHRVAWIDHGQLKQLGPTRQIIQEYRSFYQ
jgi:ABC-2 type transport system ATP-binding protein/lipopolysaccharide transport system ATP-binding protein